MRALLINIRRAALRSLKMTRKYETLCFKDYDCYGFDIDHTLARYNLQTLFQDTYNAMTKYLVKRKGYDQEAFGFDKDFCTRGLVLDLELGDFMKLAEDGTVLRASHGSRPMMPAQLKQKFGEDLHWSYFDHLINSVNNIGDRFRLFENFFDMPFGVVCAHVIDSIDKKNGGKQSEKYNIWPDVIKALEHVYNAKQFEAHAGGFFPKWKEETGRYVQTCSEPLKQWLKTLRTGKKKAFVMTSSKEDFAKASLKFILGDDWHSYFDLYITLAKKPSFFTSDRAFMRLDASGKEIPVTELCEGEFYQNGNCKVLMQHLAKFTGKENPKVLFFGDSLRSDIFPAKQFVNWDTVLVLEEINALVTRTSPHSDACEPPNKKLKSQADCDSSYLCSRQWGSLFVENPREPTDEQLSDINCSTKSKSPHTLWSYIIQKYADIAVPHLDCLTDYPLEFEFEVLNHDMLSGRGFYPNSPPELQG